MTMKITKGKKIQKIGIPANRDYSNPDDIIDTLLEITEKINEIIEELNKMKVVK